MGNDIKLNAFPSNRAEALALLYLKAQDLTGKSPSEIQTMYFEAYYEIKKDYREKHESGWLKGLAEAD